MKRVLEYFRNIFRALAKRLQLRKLRAVRNRKIKVGFFVVYDSCFPAKTVFEQMLADENFSPTIIVIPDTLRGGDNTLKQLEKSEALFVKLYGRENVVSSFDKTNCVYQDLAPSFDLACVANPYDHMTHKLYTIKRIALCCPVFYFSYYYFGKLKYDLVFMKNKSLNRLWRIYVENENSQKLFKDYLALSRKDIVVSGYPKMDEYAKCSEKAEEKVIILAPHHTVMRSPGFLNISNFLRLSDFYLRLPALYPQIKFVFRPHPLLFVNLRLEGLWGDKKTDEYLEKIREIPNLIYQDGGEYFETFAESSALIHDCGSFMAEYLYTSHPQCFLLENQEAIDREFLPFGKTLLENVYTASTEEQIIDFIDKVVLEGNDHMKEKRMAYANKHIRINYPNAAISVIDDLKQTIGRK